jgi:hypothetical protein
MTTALQLPPDAPLPRDPTQCWYPPTFPVELVLRTAPVATICAAYHISAEEFQQLKAHPQFLADLKHAKTQLAQDGMSFLAKARMQAESMLAQSWKLVHDVDTPPSVKADLIKFTVRAAGYDKSLDKAPEGPLGAKGTGALMIQINL